MGAEGFATSASTPVLQEAVHIDVGKQWARDATLRRAALVPLPANHPPLPVAIPFLDRRLEPHLDKGQDVPIHDPPGNATHQLGVRDRIEVLGEVGIDRYVYERARDFLARRHKVAGRGTKRFSCEVVYGALGLLRLERLPLAAPSCALR